MRMLAGAYPGRMPSAVLYFWRRYCLQQFDGFAIDDIMIGEAPSNNASFTYSCINGTTVSFTNTSAFCLQQPGFWGHCIRNKQQLNVTNPTHTFSGPGTYTITLNATGPDNAASTTSQTIHILGLTTSVTSTINCFGDKNGSATVNVIPAAATPLFIHGILFLRSTRRWRPDWRRNIHRYCERCEQLPGNSNSHNYRAIQTITHS